VIGDEMGVYFLGALVKGANVDIHEKDQAIIISFERTRFRSNELRLQEASMSTVGNKTYAPAFLLTLPNFQIRLAMIFPQKTAGKPEAGS